MAKKEIREMNRIEIFIVLLFPTMIWFTLLELLINGLSLTLLRMFIAVLGIVFLNMLVERYYDKKHERQIH